MVVLCTRPSTRSRSGSTQTTNSDPPKQASSWLLPWSRGRSRREKDLDEPGYVEIAWATGMTPLASGVLLSADQELLTSSVDLFTHASAWTSTLIGRCATSEADGTRAVSPRCPRIHRNSFASKTAKGRWMVEAAGIVCRCRCGVSGHV